MPTLTLEPMGEMPDGTVVFRIGNRAEADTSVTMRHCDGTFDETLTVPPGDSFIGVDLPGTYQIGPEDRALTAESTADKFQGPLDYCQTLGPVCFLTGTPVRTRGGDVPVQSLTPGDVVLGADGGWHNVRWVGTSVVSGLGLFAPVLMRAGALGNRLDLAFSPAHRLRISDWRAELLYGQGLSVVPARDLVGLPGIERAPRPIATYHHVLLDTAQMVLSAGTWSETLHPGTDIVALPKTIRAALQRLAFETHLNNAIGPTTHGY